MGLLDKLKKGERGEDKKKNNIRSSRSNRICHKRQIRQYAPAARSWCSFL